MWNIKRTYVIPNLSLHGVLRKFFVLILLYPSLSYGTPPLTEQTVYDDIKDMIEEKSKEFSFAIIHISQPVKNISIAAINPPYREFPNIVLFEYSKKTGRWNRVFEGLSIGIQPTPSFYLDLHTLGQGADMLIGKSTEYRFNEAIKEVIKTASSTGGIIIPHKNFVHFHSSGKSFYTIDKTQFYDLAVRLFGKEYEKYPRDRCTMYDLPSLLKIDLVYRDGQYFIEGETDNNQKWTISFDGVSDGKYLTDKNITVERIGEPAVRNEEPGMARMMTNKLYMAAWDLSKLGHVQRMASIDFAFGANRQEYTSLGGYGVLMVTAISHDKEELPLQRVYLVAQGKPQELYKVHEEVVPVRNKKIKEVLGTNRMDSFYLLPYSLTREKGDLFLDWRTNSKEFHIWTFPSSEAQEFVKDTKYQGEIKDIDRKTLHDFLNREFGIILNK